MKVAVVGGGLTGLACARELVGRGAEVTVFDKGRAPGGRLAGDFVDLGVQYFTVHDARFEKQVSAWREAGVCAPWAARIVTVDPTTGAIGKARAFERLVGIPDMRALALDLARGLDVRSKIRIETIRRADDGRVALDAYGVFDRVVVATPAPQAARLLEGISPTLADMARRIPMEPCFAVGVDAPLGLPFDGAFVGAEESDASPLSWISCDSSKPGRAPGERWLLHATAAFSEAALERPEASIARTLIFDLRRMFGLDPIKPARTVVQRWRMAIAPKPLDVGALVDGDVVMGGDWTSGGQVEGAYVSGLELAARVLG